MSTVLIEVRVCLEPTHETPFCVCVGDGQELRCRSLRDCMIAANGAANALQSVGIKYHEVWCPSLNKPQ